MKRSTVLVCKKGIILKPIWTNCYNGCLTARLTQSRIIALSLRLFVQWTLDMKGVETLWSRSMQLLAISFGCCIKQSEEVSNIFKSISLSKVHSTGKFQTKQSHEQKTTLITPARYVEGGNRRRMRSTAKTSLSAISNSRDSVTLVNFNLPTSQSSLQVIKVSDNYLEVNQKRHFVLLNN